MARWSIRPRGPALWQAYLVLASALVVVSLTASGTARTGAVTVAALAAALATVAAIRIHRPPSRLPWFLVAAGQAMLVLGFVAWSAGPSTLDWSFPSVPDAFFLGGCIVIALGFGVLVARRSLLPDWHMFLDAGIGTSGLALFGWVVLVDPLLAHNAPASDHVREVAYTLVDIALCFAIACLLVAPGAGKPSVRLLAAGLAAAIAGHLVVGYSANPVPVGSPADPLYALQYALFGAAALHPSIAWTPPIRRRDPRLTTRRLFALALAASLAPIILIWAGSQRAAVDYWMIGVGWIVTIVLVVACVVELVREQAATLEQQLVLERTLRDTSGLLSGIVDASPLGILVLDRGGHVRFWSRAAERMYGYEPGEVVGRMPPIVPPEERATFLSLLERALGGESLTAADLLRRTKDGADVRIRTYMGPMRDEDGNVWAAISLHEDMREVSQLQAQLFEARKMESVGRLAGGIAHDFNNILTAIIGFADLSLARPEAPDLPESLAAIKSSAERAAGLTQQLLAFSRRQMLQPQVVDVNDVVLATQTMLRRLIGEHVVLVVEPAPAACFVRADPTQLQQVLLNLAINARDAMPDGGTLEIRISRRGGAPVPGGEPEPPAGGTLTIAPVLPEPIRPDRPAVVVCVTDTGLGMDEETKAHIFEPFFTTKERGRGTGLGLATTYGIVTQSGGTIDVESAPGAGTTFVIVFPAVEPPDPTPAPERRRLRPHAGTILLVEDEPVLRDLAARVLMRAGFEVLPAEDPLQAMAIVDERPGEAIDLLLTDVVMPGMRGPELARRLRRDRPDLPVLLTSGYADEVVEKEIGGVAFLAKPFTPDDLLHSVDEAMRAGGRGHAALGQRFAEPS